MTLHMAKFGAREITLALLSDVLSIEKKEEFVALVPAFDRKDIDKVVNAVGRMIERGCMEICCVGEKAELMHEELDGLIEEKGFLHVVTTWHVDPREGCEYFLYGAGGQSYALYGFVSDRKDILAALSLVSE